MKFDLGSPLLCVGQLSSYSPRRSQGRLNSFGSVVAVQEEDREVLGQAEANSNDP
jgi:hypothetical protein